jgi:hypothetical protein
VPRLRASATVASKRGWNHGGLRLGANIVAVLGDANILTARRSTAARSALNFHTLRPRRLATGVGSS